MATLLAFAGVSTNCGCVRPEAQPFAGRRFSHPLQRLPLPQVAKPCARRFAPHAAAAAAAPPAQQAIRVKLSAYQVDLLNESVELIRTASQETGARMSGPVPLPTRRRIYTVLRSPHVNKDAREQFERRTHFRLMDLRDLSSQTVDRLMQLDLPAGVDIDVKLL